MIPPNVSLVRLLDPFVDRLEVALRHDRMLHSEPARMRLRLAIHDGEVLAESSGWAGHDVIEACRLVDAEPLRQALRDEPEANVAVIVSERVHRGAVRDGYGSIRPETFTEVDVVVKTFRSRAWIHLPGITASRPATAAREEEPLTNGTSAKSPAARPPRGPGAHPQDVGDMESDLQDMPGSVVNYGARFNASPIQMTVNGGNVIWGGKQDRVAGRDSREQHGGAAG